ncbi:hypothetical protein Hte_001217 [Hypoxylon texense]
MNRPVRIKEPESIDAPPMSSEDESQDQGADSESDDSKSRVADIKPTVFNNARQPQARNGQRNLRDRSEPSLQGKLANRSQNEEPSSSAGSKRYAEYPTPDMSHLKNEYGFTATRKKKRRNGYGSKSSQPKSSQQRSSQKSAPRSSAPQPSNNSGFKSLDFSSSPERAPSPRAKFVNPEMLTPDKTKPPKTFIKPSVSTSPSREHQKPAFRYFSWSSDESPEKSKIKLLDVDEELDTKPKKLTKSKAKTRKGSPEASQQQFSQRPAFKSYSLDGAIDYLDDSDEKAAVKSENEVSDNEAGDISIESPANVATRCPMCHEVVDAELLKKFSDHGRMNIRKQAAFCRSHKRHTALDSRSQNGYPKVNWDTIDKRCEKHHDFLRDILEGTQQSHYRNVLREKVESGKNRTLLKTQDSLTPGYYGPRGLRAMTEYIMRTLSSVVRKRAIEDRLVSARGYTGYVQIVLVPELAVRLIMEDMGVTEADAREIMHDSIEVGELLYEDVGDVIAGLSDEDR